MADTQMDSKRAALAQAKADADAAAQTAARNPTAENIEAANRAIRIAEDLSAEPGN
jgi:hypothetical protein